MAEGQDFLRATTVECSTCGGGGERVVLSTPNGGETVVRGVEAFDLLDEDGYSYEGVRECPRCRGFGRLNRAEHPNG